MYEEGKEVPCRHGWEYDRSELDLTMPSEFNWVCEKQHFITVIFTVSGISATLGTIVLGPIIDKCGNCFGEFLDFAYLVVEPLILNKFPVSRYGRRRIFVLFTIVDNLAGILRLFVPRFYPLFIAVTIFTSFIGASADIIVQELTDSGTSPITLFSF